MLDQIIRDYGFVIQSVDFKKRSQLPEQSGVYIVRHNGVAVYVGQTKNLWLRWQNHQRTYELNRMGQGLVIEYMLMPEVTAKWVERRIIKELRPKLNNTTPLQPRSKLATLKTQNPPSNLEAMFDELFSLLFKKGEE